MFYNIYAAWGIKITQFIFILIFFFTNSSLYSCNEMKDTPDTLTVTEHNNGDAVRVALGTILILKLEAIPGTGYAWHAVKAKPNLLTMIEEPIFLPKEIDSTNTPIGAPANQVFRYRAQKEGTEILELRYIRAWEKNKPPLKTFSITVYSSNEMKDTPDILTVTEHNNGDTVQVTLGTILILKLEAIPGTGYAWHIVKAKPNLLTTIEEPIFLPKEIDSTNTPIGAPAFQVFRYRAQKEGTEILELCYMRAWEKNKPPLKTFSFTVSIQK